MRLCYLLSALAVASLAASDVYLAPAKPAAYPPAFVMFVPGAMMSNTGYASLLEKVQLASDFRVWAAIPHVPLDMPLTAGELATAFKRTLAYAQQSLGMPGDATIFVGGHSMGSAVVQSFVDEHRKEIKFGGLLLTGGALLRKHYKDATWDVPAIAANGDLDGLLRVTRSAESFFRNVGQEVTRPVVIVEGASHAQASNETPSIFVKANDLVPDISLEDAQVKTAVAFADFMSSMAHPDKATAAAGAKAIAELVKKTGVVLEPIIKSMQLEGSVHLADSCNSDHPSPHCPFYPAYPNQDERTPSTDTSCTCGCPWTMQITQKTLAGLESSQYDIVVVDAIHDVTDTKPLHHPHLWNNCSGMPAGCKLNVTTVSQLVYPSLDDFDTGYLHNSATEIRAKLKSRQAIYQSSVDPLAELDVVDKPSLCGEVNKKAYQWALENAGPAALERYNKYGQMMTFAEDFVTIEMGPAWIYTTLKFDNVDDAATGTKVMQVTGVAMKSATQPILIPYTDGYHYCKILSPARAMEWIYLDGLRLNKGL